MPYLNNSLCIEMNYQPNITLITSAIAEPARALILTVLMDGCAYTATELANVAGIGRSTASSHLAKLLHAGLIEQTPQGRHKYFRLASSEVAEMIENIMSVSHDHHSKRVVSGPKNSALRDARICYDHLAGTQGVWFYDQLVAHKFISLETKTITDAGTSFFANWSLNLDESYKGSRPFCRSCLDWSERRPHLAGVLGARWLKQLFDMAWCQREKESRIITFTQRGAAQWKNLFSNLTDT